MIIRPIAGLSDETNDMFRMMSDPSLIEVPWGSAWDDPNRHRRRFIRRATLAKLTTIEAVRWNMLLRRLPKLYVKGAAIRAEIERAGDAFVPADDKDPLGIGVDKEGNLILPRHISVEQDRRFGKYISDSRDFWGWVPAKLMARQTGLSQLAEIGDLVEQDQEMRRRAAEFVTPEKLAIGRRHRDHERRVSRMHYRVSKLNSLIEMAVRALGLIPQPKQEWPTRLISLQINGRLYQFEYDHCHIKAKPDYWPEPNAQQLVVVADTYQLDKSLIGQRPEVVRTRLGEPDQVFDGGGSSDDPLNIWVYGDRGVVVPYHGGVKAVLSPEELALARAEARKRKKKKVKRA